MGCGKLRILNSLIEQAKNPNGWVGSLMLRMMNTVHTGMNKWAFKKLPLEKDSIMLDIGCGGGKTIQALSKIIPEGKIYGIDYSEQAVKDSIQANFKDVETGKVTIFKADVTNAPFQEKFFDTITGFQTHYFWDDIESGVKEIFRILKYGGCLLLVAEVYKMNYHMESYKTKDEMEQLLINTGFHNVISYENKNKGWLMVKGSK